MLIASPPLVLVVSNAISWMNLISRYHTIHGRSPASCAVSLSLVTPSPPWWRNQPIRIRIIVMIPAAARIPHLHPVATATTKKMRTKGLAETEDHLFLIIINSLGPPIPAECADEPSLVHCRLPHSLIIQARQEISSELPSLDVPKLQPSLRASDQACLVCHETGDGPLLAYKHVRALEYFRSCLVGQGRGGPDLDNRVGGS